MLSYLNDHRIEGVAVFSAALYVEMAWAAAAEAFSSESFVLKDMDFHRALFLPDGGTRTTQVVLSPGADGTASIHIYSRPHGAEPSNGSWTLHATGRMCPARGLGIPQAVESGARAEVEARCPEQISGQEYYLRLRERGIDYGPSFQSITRLWRCNGETLGEVKLADRPDGGFDACLQTLGAGVAARATEDGDQGTYMPTHVDEIRIHGRPGLNPWCHARLQAGDTDVAKGDVRLLDETGQVAVEISGLRFESLARATQENPDDWLYELQWQPKDRLDGEASAVPAEPGTWLIFADRGGVGDALAAVIDADGGRSVVVAHGPSYERSGDTHFWIRPEQPEDIRRVLDAALTSNPVCRGVVHLWSLDAPVPEQMTAAPLEAAQLLGCGNVLHLIHELGRVEERDTPRLWLVTRGSQPAGEETSPLNTAQAPLWGLGRVIAQEHSMLWGGLIDLDPGTSPQDESARQLWKEVSAPDGEDQIAFRRGRRYAGRLVRRGRSATQGPPLRLRTDGSYLITGGLGDLGLSVARWMVEQGARRLILLGRTKLPPRAHWRSVEAGSRLAQQLAGIRELEALGASVHLASVDVADECQLGAFLDEFRSEGWPPIRGAVHAAGVLQDGLLMQLDSPALNSVLRPKVMGAWLLHRLLEDAPLDFFVLFSSAGSLLGQPGQGNYAAANAFLDALAHHRRARGQPALSINWGAWSELGFAETAGGKRLATRLALLGIKSIAPKQALEVLERLLRQSSTQVAVVPVDWQRYRQFYPPGTESPLLSLLAREGADGATGAGHSAERRSTILAAEPAERLGLLQSYLSEQVARVLGLATPKVDVRQPLSNLGLDSLMAVELKNAIAVDLGVNVPMVKFLSGPTIEQAAAELFHLLASEPSRSSALLVPRSRSDVDELSDEEVNSLLTDMLAEEEVGE